MISFSSLCNALLIASLLVQTPALAYRPLTGLYANAPNAPVVTRSVSTSLADKDGLLESNWDTTIVLEQKDVRDVAWVEVSFSLLSSQSSPVRVRKVVLNKDHPWKQGERWEYRLQETHMGWPGDATLVQVTAVAFTNGELWKEDSEGAFPSREQTTPVSQEPAKTAEPSYIPPTMLTGSDSIPGESGSSNSAYSPRPRVLLGPNGRYSQSESSSSASGPTAPVASEE